RSRPANTARLVHELPLWSAERFPNNIALAYRNDEFTYAEFVNQVTSFASLLIRSGLNRFDRVGIFLPKSEKAVIAMFGICQAGCIFVPANPVLKPGQVAHILRDSAARALITTFSALQSLMPELSTCTELELIILSDASERLPESS